MVTGFFSILPWFIIGVIILAFSLADDLPARKVGGAFLAIGAVMPILIVGLLAYARLEVRASYLFAAFGPLIFLIIHHLLRIVFRGWKGEEPVLISTAGSRSGANRFFYEPEAARRVSFIDYLYSFLLGVGMLLSASGAGAMIVENGG